MDAELIDKKKTENGKTKTNEIWERNRRKLKLRDELSGYTYVVRRISLPVRCFRSRRRRFFGRWITWLNGWRWRFGHGRQCGRRRWRWRHHIFGDRLSRRRHHSNIISNLNLNLMRPISIRNCIVFALIVFVHLLRRTVCRQCGGRTVIFGQRRSVAEEFFDWRHFHGARWVLAIRIVVDEFNIV